VIFNTMIAGLLLSSSLVEEKPFVTQLQKSVVIGLMWGLED